MKNQFTFYTYGRQTIASDWPISYFAGVNRLYYVHNGTANYQINKSAVHQMRQGFFYLFPASLPVKFSLVDEVSFDHTFFDFTIIPSLLQQQVICFPGEGTPLLQGILLFLQIFERFGQRQQTLSFLENHFETILYLFQLEAPLRRLEDQRIQTSLERIHLDFSKPMSISNLAKEAHTEETHFIRIFKASTGLTPYQYLKHYRMNTALGLLQEGTSVQTTALSCGYQSSAAFSSAFFHHFGQYPSKVIKK